MGMYFYVELVKKNFLELIDPLSIIEQIKIDRGYDMNLCFC